MGDWQFLYIDLILVTSLALVMSRTGPHDVISTKRPWHSLMNCVIIGGVLSHAAVTLVIQTAALLLLRMHKWLIISQRLKSSMPS